MSSSTRQRAHLEAHRGGRLPDLIDADTRLLFVGTNPGLSAVAVQAPFPGRNRFFPALFRAAIIDWLIDTSGGWKLRDREHLIERGVGITALVPEATARASELDDEDLVAGAARLERLTLRFRPAAVAVLGTAAYRIAFAAPRAIVGRQPDLLASAQLWVVPNPSGANRRVSLDELAAAYRQVANAAR